MRPYAFAAGLAAMLVLAGCGAGQEPATPDGSTPTATAVQHDGEQHGTGEHNEADVAFAQQMIPHHEQAVQMSEMVLAKATTPQVRDLAQRIRAAQDPEIETMAGWLRAWGEEPGAFAEGGHGPGMPMGMMSDEHWDRLRHGVGADVGRMYLTMMIEHHEGAVAMARTEIDDGRAPEAIALAERIVRAQEAEIREMRGLLGEL